MGHRINGRSNRRRNGPALPWSEFSDQSASKNSTLAGDASANLAALKKVDSWSQGEIHREGRLGQVAGSNPPEQMSAVAKACAVLLAGRITKN